jgi:hypothetical protein
MSLMNWLSAWMRCFSPRSIQLHSLAVTMRGTRSKGNGRSVPAESP